MPKISHQSISKTYGYSQTLANEDRQRIFPNLVAIADGAGGTGILCGEWAGFLLEHLPTQNLVSFEAFLAFLEPQAQAFVDKFEPLMQQDAFQLKRFYQEGSAAALAALWQNAEGFQWLTYGDCHVFYYVAGQLQSYPYSQIEQFSGRSYLLNWCAMPLQEGFAMGHFSGVAGSKILLATDAIAKYILQQYQQNKSNFDAFLQELKTALASPEQFNKYIKTQKNIDEDDYTLILLEV